MGKLQTVLETKSLPNAAPGLRFLFICLSPWEPLQLPTHLSALQARENILAWNYNHDNHQFFLPCLLQPFPAYSPIPGLIQTKEAFKTKAISQFLFFFFSLIFKEQGVQKFTLPVCVCLSVPLLLTFETH